jgi:hypothetical protein
VELCSPVFEPLIHCQGDNSDYFMQFMKSTDEDDDESDGDIDGDNSSEPPANSGEQVSPTDETSPPNQV